MIEQGTTGKGSKRYFALVWLRQGGSSGWPMHYYPEEKAFLARMYRRRIVGDFATREEAEIAVGTALAKHRRRRS